MASPRAGNEQHQQPDTFPLRLSTVRDQSSASRESAISGPVARFRELILLQHRLRPRHAEFFREDVEL
jgi:hypothetical protein